MFRRALMGSGAHRRQAGRSTAAGVLAALFAAGCGGGGERQDADEPRGRFEVEVTRASFPSDQKLAKKTAMVIAVKNVDDKTIPNVAVTVDSFDTRLERRDVADPRRPIFIVDSGPRGGVTAYSNTSALGPLKPGETKTFRWKVTAALAVPYKIEYRVSAGLDGRARAVLADGSPPRGVFQGAISDTPPDSAAPAS